MSKEAYAQAKRGGTRLLLIDTAGRSQLDDFLMQEIDGIQKAVPCNEILLVIDSMIGQEALNIAEGFRDVMRITGLIFTKIDGDARGGAAISIREVTGIPIKFLGTGEGLDAIEVFDPARISGRILRHGRYAGFD